MQFLFSASSVWVLWAVAAFAIASAFLKGDAGNFSRSVGVCVLLLSQRTSCAKFLVRFVSQVRIAHVGGTIPRLLDLILYVIS